MMTAKNENATIGKSVSAREIYMEFLDNMRERADIAVTDLTDRMTTECDVDRILALQKELKRASRKVDILNRLRDGVRPIDIQEIIDNVADPEVREELRPVFNVIQDLRCALNMTQDDVRAIAEREA